MECDLVSEELEDFFHFQNIHVEVHIDQSSKTMPKAVIYNQQNNQSRHLIGKCT
jgi:hypothetical protein